jgi:hypothetical protein
MEDARLRGVKEGKAKDSSHDSQMSALKEEHAEYVDGLNKGRAKMEADLEAQAEMRLKAHDTVRAVDTRHLTYAHFVNFHDYLLTDPILFASLTLTVTLFLGDRRAQGHPRAAGGGPAR